MRVPNQNKIVLGLLPAIALFSCGPEDQTQTQVGQGKAGSALTNTYIGDYIEIDEVNGGPGDANLVVDGHQLPLATAANPTWTDWDEISTGTHQFLDISSPDISSFPRSNGCVGTSQVLSKMDLTYVGVANNQEYAYFTVQRANNNGDAGYYWLMTKLAPESLGVAGPCKAGEDYIEYTIQKDDILLAGHFQPSGSPLLRAFRAINAAPVKLDAVMAINYQDASLWFEDNSAIAAVAVNTSAVDPGTWGSQGVSKQALTAAGYLEPELLAEAALKTSFFTGGSVCGAKFYGSVITRSSGAGGTTPDLKDFFGPEEFSFGDVSAEVKLASTCDQKLDYCATLTGIDGNPVQSPSCSWTIKNKISGALVTPPADCCGKLALSPGAYEVSVVVADPQSPCSETKGPTDVIIYPQLSAQATLTPSCASSFGYTGSGVDGLAPYSYSWAFSGASTPQGSTSQSGSVAVGQGNVDYTADLQVTDARGCKALVSKQVKPYAPLQVSLGVYSVDDVCSTDTDAASFLAAASGGDGNYAYSWSVIGSEPLSCSPGSGSGCTIDPTDDNMCVSSLIAVQLSDSSGLFSAVLSNQVKYD